MEERSYREELRRHQEKEILQEFARVYGYDVNKHQPDPNNGEIDVEYLQAYIAECRQKEEKLAERLEAEKSLAKQKEALKGKVAAVTKPKSASTNNTGTKSSAPSVKKQLTVETDHNLAAGSGSTGSDSATPESSDSSSQPGDPAKGKDEEAPASLGTSPASEDGKAAGADAGTPSAEPNEEESPSSDGSPALHSTQPVASTKFAEQEGEDDFARDDGADGQPMTREELEQHSSDSAGNVARRLKPATEAEDGADEPIAHHEQMSATLSQQSLQEMLQSVDQKEPAADANSSQE